MSDRPSSSRGPWWVAPFAVVTYVALVVCAFGFISLLTNLEVIEEVGTNPLVGPIMVVVPTVFLFVMILRESRRVPPRVEVWFALVCGVVAWFLYAFTGGVLEWLGSGDGAHAVILFASTMVRPFALAVGVIAVVTVLAAAAVAANAAGHPPRPRWPWERRDTP
ncbi:DUF6121 family protein [Plantibacter sp. YIM 135347]|uniref:DUF6121 family protein n=1 Tax=Plantibacter sp. YIM 135347 TaxID=3423919 RepID=UPI003D346B80